MSIPTIKAIYWSAVAAFWALTISDWVTPGRAPLWLDLAESLSLYTLIGAHCYMWGARRANKTTTNYEINAYEKSN